jgi:hypothetical protein
MPTTKRDGPPTMPAADTTKSAGATDASPTTPTISTLLPPQTWPDGLIEELRQKVLEYVLEPLTQRGPSLQERKCAVDESLRRLASSPPVSWHELLRYLTAKTGSRRSGS